MEGEGIKDNDLARVAGQRVTEVIAKYIDELISFSKNKIDSKISTKFIDLKTYLEKSYSKCSTVRLMIDRDRLYNIRDIYVNGTFHSSGSICSDDDILDRLRKGKRLVVQGFGGIGKTMLLKNLWMRLFELDKGRVPIFIELRRLNELSSKNLLNYVKTYISPDNSVMPDATFLELMKEGRFVFLFDGFDELNDEYRRDIGNQIISLAYNSPRCGCVVSSRTDDQFVSWEQFEVWHANPFTKEQIVEVVQRVHFDQKVKKRFLSDVIESKYDVYTSFLSTPLLALMMLLTYDQFADLPEKVHIFYRYAFQTLYSLHDAAKESFQRKRKTGLNEDDFAKVFSIFCLMSYKDMSYSFSEDLIKGYVNIAKKRACVDVNTDLFIEEVVESVNLIYREGNLYSFVHRSFQEYFCAFAIINFYQDKLAEVMAKIPRRSGDSMLNMLYEMNPELVEDKYIFPAYEEVSVRSKKS